MDFFRSALAALLLLFMACSASHAEVAFGGYVATPGNGDKHAMAKAAVDLKNILADGGKVRLMRVKTIEIKKDKSTAYRICMRVKQAGRRFDVQATVLRLPAGKPLLTGWKPDGC